MLDIKPRQNNETDLADIWNDIRQLLPWIRYIGYFLGIGIPARFVETQIHVGVANKCEFLSGEGNTVLKSSADFN